MPQTDFPFRKRLILVFIVCLVIFLFVDHYGLLDFDRMNAGLPGEARAERIRWVLRILFLPLLPIGLYLTYLGLKVIRSGVFPPPDSRLVKPTATQTGPQARLRGWFILLTGVCLCGLAWYGAVVIPNEITQLLSPQ
jgi:hypothetical protein